ncbi:2151_t:CDS:1, partial [Paraglomus occultum]
MKRLAQTPSPSDMARIWYQTSNSDQVFLNHRPTSSVGLPTALLHPVFGEFLDGCSNAIPTPDDFIFAKSLSEAMSDYYAVEDTRATKFRQLFNQHFKISLRCVELCGCRTDGTWYPNHQNDFIGINVEVKKEPGAG